MLLENNEHVHITNPKRTRAIIHAIQAGGLNNLAVVADFAKTMTPEFVNGVRLPPLVSQLRTGEYMSGVDYPTKANALFEQYSGFEQDPTISLETLKEKWLEWWTVHYQLLIESGLSREILKAIANKKEISLRDGVREFLVFLNQHNIPLVFVSAAPGDLLREHLDTEQALFPNIFIAGNNYEFDTTGKVVHMPGPVIHTYNKGDIDLTKLSFYPVIQNRKNVILLGDSISDADMTASLPAAHVLKIGLLNKDTATQLAPYAEHYDIVLTGDSSMAPVSSLLKGL